MPKDKGNTSHSTTVFGAAQELTKRKGVVAGAINNATSNIAQSATKFPATSNSAGKKKNKQFLADKKKLNSMSRSQIETLRSKLKAKRESIKTVPLL